MIIRWKSRKFQPISRTQLMLFFILLYTSKFSVFALDWLYFAEHKIHWLKYYLWIFTTVCQRILFIFIFVLTSYCVETKIAFSQFLFTICQLALIFLVECRLTLSTVLLLSRPIAFLYICLYFKCSCTNDCHQTNDLMVRVCLILLSTLSLMSFYIYI